MAKSNPVRGNYLLVGTELVRAGIRTLNGITAFYRENDLTSVILSVDPRTERWITSRAVASAAAKAGVPLDVSSIAASTILPFLQQDPRMRVRTTEEQIVHMLGGETPENRAFAQAQLAELEATYSVVPAAAVNAA